LVNGSPHAPATHFSSKEKHSIDIFTQGNPMVDIKKSTKDKASAALHVAKGTVKEQVGKATDNQTLRAKGLAQQAVGHAQDAVSKVEKSVGK